MGNSPVGEEIIQVAPQVRGTPDLLNLRNVWVYYEAWKTGAIFIRLWRKEIVKMTMNGCAQKIWVMLVQRLKAAVNLFAMGIEEGLKIR